MTVTELIAHLQTFPGDLQVAAREYDGERVPIDEGDVQIMEPHYVSVPFGYPGRPELMRSQWVVFDP